MLSAHCSGPRCQLVIIKLLSIVTTEHTLLHQAQDLTLHPCVAAFASLLLICTLTIVPHIQITPNLTITLCTSPNLSKMRVLVSGAGIAGCTVAWHLARLGSHVSVTVVEKAPALLPHGQNIDISGSARTVIDRMGLTDKVKAHNTTEQGTQFIGPHGQVYASFPVKENSSASPTSEFEILRGDLAALLYKASRDLPNVRYLFSTVVHEVVSNDERSVRVTLHNHKSEKTMDKQEFDLLIAADGQWSNIRKQCFPASSITIVDKHLYVAYWTAQRTKGDNEQWNIYQALNSRGISVRPDPYGTVRVSVTRMPCTAQQKQAWEHAIRASRQEQQALVAREFADAGWQAERFIESMAPAEDFYFQVRLHRSHLYATHCRSHHSNALIRLRSSACFCCVHTQAVQQIRMSHWSQQRVVCLGDAGYAPSPITGMGTSLAIQGAYVLAGELSELEQGDPPTRAFIEYERKFKPFVEKVQNLPFFVPAVVHPASAWKRWVLQVFIMAMAAVVRWEWLVQQLSALVKKDDFPLPHFAKLTPAHKSPAKSIKDGN